MQALSSNGFSVDLQLEDVMYHIRDEHWDDFVKLVGAFPEWVAREWEGSWLDTEAMGVDPEWACWLIDAVENTGRVFWEEGEPWGA